MWCTNLPEEVLMRMPGSPVFEASPQREYGYIGNSPTTLRQKEQKEKAERISPYRQSPSPARSERKSPSSSRSKSPSADPGTRYLVCAHSHRVWSHGSTLTLIALLECRIQLLGIDCLHTHSHSHSRQHSASCLLL